MNKNSHGIGLNVCKNIMLGLDGDLVAKSEKKKGSIFTLNFKTDKTEVKQRDANPVEI